MHGYYSPATSDDTQGLCWTIFARNRDAAVPAEGNGDLQTLICVLMARPRRCLTLSNPVPWQNWMAAYLGYTLWMKTLLRGWPVMAHETHTTRRYREIFNEQTSDTKTQNAASLTATATQSSTAQTVNQHSAWNHRIVRVFWQWPEVFTEYLTISVFHIQLAHAFDSEAHI